MTVPASAWAAALADPRNAHAASELRRLAGGSQSTRQSVEVPHASPAAVVGAREGDAQIISLVLPLPPSVNSYWRSVPATRNRIARVLISEQGRRFKRACREAALAQCPKPLTGDVSLRCIVYFKDRRRDLDNICKPLFDALNGVVYGDDRQVAHFGFTKRIDPRRPRVEMLVAPWVGD